MAESGRVAQRTGTLAKGRPAEGLYDPAYEHDACGVAFVADIAGRRDHRTVSRGLTALINLEHRGARGAEPETGDGAGILIQVPDGLYRPLLAEAGVELPARRPLRGGQRLPARRRRPGADLEVIVARVAAEEGLEVLAWRELPVDPDGAGIGPTARAVMPRFRQLFVGLPPEVDHVVDTPNAGDDDAGIVLTLERRAFAPAQARRARVAHRGRRDLLPEPVRTHRRLQGDARRGAARAVLRRPRRRAHHQLDRAGAQPLLHQHVPGVEPRAPVPLPRAQRRDQHAARQPQLDGRARDRCSPPARSGGRARPALPDRHPRTPATRRRSTRCSSCCTSAGARCRTRC